MNRNLLSKTQRFGLIAVAGGALLVGSLMSATQSSLAQTVLVQCTSPVSVCATVVCAAQLTGGIPIYPATPSWNWGDGTSSLGVSAQHVYVSPGTYKVTFYWPPAAGTDSTAAVSGSTNVTVTGGNAATPAVAAPPAIAGTCPGGALVALGSTCPTAPVQPPLQAPVSPLNLQATPLDSTRVRLDWSRGSSNEDGFGIYSPYGLVNYAAGTSYTVVNLDPGGYYCLIVYAFNSAGNSGWSNWACVITSL